MMTRTRIEITGIVQGVGFRPFIYKLAVRHGLRGICQNTSRGVLIEVAGDGIRRFIDEIRKEAPPLSRIDAIAVEETGGDVALPDFQIVESAAEPGRFALISPDIATCPDCLRELFDPADRRYRYPFVNCTNCGPRYSIVFDIPYDRPKTTMAPFTMCPACEAEYHDPLDRRFHAQPNACHLCGPRLELMVKNSEYSVKCDDAVDATLELLGRGAIGAIKGLGGFHLACDAASPEAVGRIRERKRRSNKPFAVMVRDVAAARRLCIVTDEEERLLEGRVRPIILLGKRTPSPLAEAVAPGHDTLGVMLPYTPLHALLLHGPFPALVMTSGNLAEEPIVIDNEEAMKRLTVADFFLMHNREIYMRVDDSIITCRGGVHPAQEFTVIRRSRGFAPEAIDLCEEVGEVLACGAELKNTFCLTKGRYAIMSQHMGDLQNYESLQFFEETLKNLKKTFRVSPSVVARDMHPDYMSSGFAAEYARRHGIPDDRVIGVQHHHAHVVACMAEHGLHDPVIGIAFDGTGYGADGQVWGGEFLVADRAGFERKAHIRYVPLPGGDRAAREPWRMALSWLFYALGDDAKALCPWFLDRLDPKAAKVVIGMLENGAAPLTSSAGRLFDAVSSLVGLVDLNTCEGEAAMVLEARAREAGRGRGVYPYTISSMEIDLAPIIRGIADDMRAKVEVPVIASRFHETMGRVVLDAARRMRDETGISSVVLSGGVFQNMLLSGMVRENLSMDGFLVYGHEKVPPGDGGISLGQAVVAWERIRKGG